MIQVDEYYWNGLKPPTRHGTPSQMGHLSSAFLRARTFHPRWRFVQKAIFELIACKIPTKRWHSLGKIIFLRFVQGVFFGLYQGKISIKPPFGRLFSICFTLGKSKINTQNGAKCLKQRRFALPPKGLIYWKSNCYTPVTLCKTCILPFKNPALLWG